MVEEKLMEIIEVQGEEKHVQVAGVELNKEAVASIHEEVGKVIGGAEK